MPFTVDEFKEMVGYVRSYMMHTNDRNTHDYIQHLEEAIKNDLDFRHFIKNHYPEALVEWNALQKLGE
jgi:hypothetical protein